MSVQLRQEDVTSSLLQFWSDTFPLSVATIYPGQQVNTADFGEWIELWVESWTQGPQRATAKERLTLAVTAHCFVRPGTDKGRITELADAARSTLSGQSFPVRNYEADGNPQVGYAQIFEPDFHDLTRRDWNARRHAMQHIVLTWSGTTRET